jgi:hypothetical protein
VKVESEWEQAINQAKQPTNIITNLNFGQYHVTRIFYCKTCGFSDILKVGKASPAETFLRLGRYHRK